MMLTWTMGKKIAMIALTRMTETKAQLLDFCWIKDLDSKQFELKWKMLLSK